MKTKKEIVVLEDNKELLDIYVDILSRVFKVNAFSTSQEFLNYISTLNVEPVLMVTDLYLIETDIFELYEMQNVRDKLHSWPCLVVSVKDDIQTMRKCLELWADDYLVKPFNHNELLYKCEKLSNLSDNFRLDTKTMAATYLDLRSAELSAKEFQVLSYLLDTKKAHSKDELIRDIWGSASSPNILNSILNRLRPKILPLDHNVQIDRNGIVSLTCCNQKN